MKMVEKNLQPIGPTGIASAGIISHPIHALAVNASVPQTFVNVRLAEVALVTGQAVASVIGPGVETFGAITAL